MDSHIWTRIAAQPRWVSNAVRRAAGQLGNSQSLGAL